VRANITSTIIKRGFMKWASRDIRKLDTNPLFVVINMAQKGITARTYARTQIKEK
jgi:hypothetical protein